MSRYYIDINDLRSLMQEQLIEAAINEDATILEQAIGSAEDEAFSYLNDRYNVAVIAEQRGSDRSPVLVMKMSDCAIYHLSALVNFRHMNELRQTRYDAAIRWYEKVAKGDINVNLPYKPADEAINVRSGGIVRWATTWGIDEQVFDRKDQGKGRRNSLFPYWNDNLNSPPNE